VAVGLHPESFLQKNTVEKAIEAIKAGAAKFLHIVFGFPFIRENRITLAAESNDELDGGVVRLTVGSAKHDV